MAFECAVLYDALCAVDNLHSLNFSTPSPPRYPACSTASARCVISPPRMTALFTALRSRSIHACTSGRVTLERLGSVLGVSEGLPWPVAIRVSVRGRPCKEVGNAGAYNQHGVVRINAGDDEGRASSLPCELRLVARPTVAHTGGYLRLGGVPVGTYSPQWSPA
jgi:hypothetical protein